ncbi:hypothetical protein LVD15_23160 [Fulvivirga maritima]|uniref:hypothetical protein n=1 Tax=Fulvivirga maritima TaxID=2904247 RepID=UPI001F280E49|nr:hypothetical protein [Fulvivirga maritima]UII26169.1 hypothetical protein LVD15_23160 [Fulvivirga maritima]
MKIPFALIILSLIFISCGDDDADLQTRVIDVDLTMNEVYVFNSGNSGDEEGGEIINQASHFSISEIDRDSAMQIIYRYQPEAGYVGIDHVQIQLATGSDGSGPSTQFEYVTFNFNISE